MGSRILLLWPLLICCYQGPIFAANTISPGQALSGNQTIASSGGIFELGYFVLGYPERYYLGIWYMQIPTDNVVWVANRDNPLQDDTAEFKISEDGNLVLQTQSKVISWSTNVTSTSRSPSRIVVLEDSGNLVLRDANSSNNIVWDSFSHPTHTWLPGGSLGLNKVTNEYQILTSWKNKEDPSPGPFSLELDPNGSAQYFIVWNRTQQYWTSGVWDNQTFSEVPEMGANYHYYFSFVDNDTARYFTYSVYNSSILRKFVIDLSGQIKQLTWVEESQQWIVFWALPTDQCEVYGLCGDFGVCDVEKKNPCNCIDGFEPASLQDWRLSDWSGGCMRTVALQCESDQFSFQTFYNYPVNSSTVSVNHYESCKSACLEDCSCSAYFSQITECFIWKGGLLNLRQEAVGNENGVYVRVSNLGTLDRGVGKKHSSFVKITVTVAVTSLGILFAAAGACYLSKSMAKKAADPILSKQLGWEKRFEIVMGIARGLQYLHQESRLKIIHRDLKTSNILLDAAMNPRISDFGLARIFCDEQSHISTMKIAGTCGYMPPEYAMEGRYSTKSDVFSFGVIVLEVVSGLKMTSFRNEEYSLNLLGHAWKLWNEAKIEELLDHSLGTPHKLGQVLRCVNVGLLCVQEDAVARPTMSSVVLMLSSDSANLASPSQPAYSRKARSPDRDST